MPKDTADSRVPVTMLSGFLRKAYRPELFRYNVPALVAAMAKN